MQQKKLEMQIRKLKQVLGKITGMRPGALSRQFAACQKPGYACIDPVRPKKHGPFYQLSYSHRGKSTTRFIRPGYVTTVKRELANYKRFRELSEDWVALEIELSQLKLEEARHSESKQSRTRYSQDTMFDVSGLHGVLPNQERGVWHLTGACAPCPTII